MFLKHDYCIYLLIYKKLAHHYLKKGTLTRLREREHIDVDSLNPLLGIVIF